LERHGVRRGERILLKTVNSGQRWKSDAFFEEFVYLAADAAHYLAGRGVRLVGVDYLSVGAFRGDGEETHKALLGAGVWIVEGLNLAKVRPGPVEFVCLPLKLLGADGAPARALIRPLQGGGGRR
jgi:arylformamidase